MRIIAMTIAAALATASAVEYVDGEQFTFSDGTAKSGVYLQEFDVLAIWTSRGTADGPTYGISILKRSDVKSRKPIKGVFPPQAYPVNGAVFEPEAAALLEGDRAAEVTKGLGLTDEPAQAATKAASTLALIKAAAMKRIKP